MRTFDDENGQVWVAAVRERTGPDYKGRYVFVAMPADAEKDAGVELPDVRWNSLRTAERTLSTMSDVELRRRLRSALGRSGVSVRP